MARKPSQSNRYANAAGTGDPYDLMGKRFDAMDRKVGQVFAEFPNASAVAVDQANPRKSRNTPAEIARMRA